MSTEEIAFTGHEGAEVKGLLCLPDGVEEGDDAPAIVLVHEVFGLDLHLREIAERLVGEGFCVLIPDLYSRGGPPGPVGTEADPAPQWEVDTIRSAVLGLPDRQALFDIDAAAGFLGSRGEVDRQSIAVVGFCMGGTLAFLSGCTSMRFACVVEFYGRVLYSELSETKPIQPIEMLLNLDRPLLAFFGEADESISADDVAMLRKHLADANKDFEVVTYPDAGHSFFNHRRPGYHRAAAEDAWERTVTFLRERL